MAHPHELKEKVKKWRLEGTSIKTIARRIGLPQSTISLWVRNVPLPEEAQGKLFTTWKTGAEKGRELMRIRRVELAEKTKGECRTDVDCLTGNASRKFWKLIASLLIWCEGAKYQQTSVNFINSDPKMVATFLKALRAAFDLDEKKFRCRLHLHEYHDARKQLAFWSQVTGIPTNQFRQPYLKPHTGKRKRKEYPGCLSLSYYDARVAKTLSAMYHAFAECTGAWCNG